MATADMDGDGLDDLVTSSGDSIYIYYQSASHILTQFHRGYYTGGYLTDGNIKIGDVDHDGYKDVTMLVTSIPAERILYGTGTRDSFITMDYPQSGANLRVNQIGKLGTSADLYILHTYTTYNGGTSVSAHIMAEHINSQRQIDTILYYHIGPVWQGVNDIATLDRHGDGNYALMAATQGNWPNSTLAVWDHPDHTGYADTIMTIYDNADALVPGDFNCSGGHELVIAHAGYAVSLIDGQSRVDTMYADLPNNMDIGDMLVADVTGDDRPDIVLVNTYAGVTVLQSTTPLASDSLILSSLILRDTVLTGQYDSTFHIIDTLHAAGAMLIKQTVLSVSYQEQDTMKLVLRSGLAFHNCHTDTIFFTDTAVIKTVHINSDSTYTFDTINIPNDQAERIKIYPDPFTSDINIRGVDSSAWIEIYNEIGSLVISQNCASNCLISSAGLPQGIYTVRITGQGLNYRRRIVSMSDY